MSIRRVVPDVPSDDFQRTKEFYVGLFGFDVAMEMDWVMTLASPSNPTAQITFSRADASASVQPQVSIEVVDVDEVHADAKRRGLEIVYPLTDEPWGVRRFFVVDPNGLVLNILTHGATVS